MGPALDVVAAPVEPALVDGRTAAICGAAMLIAAAAGFVAKGLTSIIAFVTNLAFYGRVSFAAVSPAGNHLGVWLIAIPVIGGLIVGVMARWGSAAIRGHGIPEAMEQVLFNQSRIPARITFLKPLSAAIAIGTGGPFGAEGPIIATGGALGSVLGQFVPVTAHERKTLLAAGAAAGMAATFGTPVSAVLLAIELLLFEYRARSVVPVALASATATAVRMAFGDAGAVFPMPALAPPSGEAMTFYIILGAVMGLLATGVTRAVYWIEDVFEHLPVHWVWWPAIGGVAVGLVGLVAPRTLGVGYDLIAEMLSGHYVASALLPLILVKALIWSVALGSGTSGGVLAPLLIIGGALGGLESTFMPGGDAALWPLLGMASVMGGTMRSPLTGIVFALELTDDIRLLLPLLIAVVVAHAFTVLVMKRSILTEKVARRGHHVSREYSLDPLERLLARDVMSTEVITVPASMPVRQLVREYFLGTARHRHQGYPVVDRKGEPVGMVTKSDLLQEWLGALLQDEAADTGPVITWDVASRPAIAIDADASCRTAAERMAQSNVGRLLVVAPDDPKRLLGVITRSDLLKARARSLEEESSRERYIRIGPARSG